MKKRRRKGGGGKNGKRFNSIGERVLLLRESSVHTVEL